MKKATKFIFCVLIAVFSSNLCLSQNGEYSVERAISLYKDSETNIVEIKVQEKTKQIDIKIISTIESGNLTIEIYDPNNEKLGNLSIGSMFTISGAKTNNVDAKENNKRDEDVIGRIDRRFENPSQGTWIIKFIPKEAECDIHLMTYYVF